MLRKNKIFKTIIAIVFWVLVWELLSLLVGKAVILPSPVSVASRLGELLITGDFYLTCLNSIARIFAGLLSGIAVGVILAVLSKLSFVLDAIISPAVSVIKSTPVASIIILLLFIFVKGIIPVLASILIVVPIIYENVRNGFDNLPTNLVETARIYNLSRGKKARMLWIPSIVPFFVAGCKSALGIAWKAGVAAEVICVPAMSIGSMLYDAKVYIESNDLFAWTIVVIILSFVIEKLLIGLISKIGGRWANG